MAGLTLLPVAPAPTCTLPKAAEAAFRCPQSESNRIEENSAIRPKPRANLFSADHTAASLKKRIAPAAAPLARRNYTGDAAGEQWFAGFLVRRQHDASLAVSS